MMLTEDRNEAVGKLKQFISDIESGKIESIVVVRKESDGGFGFFNAGTKNTEEVVRMLSKAINMA